MAGISKNCNVRQGYNLAADAQVMIGHVNSLKIGDKALAVDQKVKNPIDRADVKVVGLLSGVFWNGEASGPINFAMQVSTDNKNTLKSLVHGDMKKIDVEVKFTQYEYDLKEKTYFKGFHSNDAVVKGLIHKQGGQLSIDIADEAGVEVLSPANFTLGIAVMPQDTEQALHQAFSNTMKRAEDWGVTVGA